MSKLKRWTRPAPAASASTVNPIQAIRRQCASIGVDLAAVSDAAVGAALMRASASHGPKSANPNEDHLIAEFLERVTTGRVGV